MPRKRPIGLVGLLQLGLLSGALAAGASITGLLTVPALSSVFWMLGWFLFAGLLAAAGARVSRQEEVQSAINPVSSARLKTSVGSRQAYRPVERTGLNQTSPGFRRQVRGPPSCRLEPFRPTAQDHDSEVRQQHLLAFGYGTDDNAAAIR